MKKNTITLVLIETNTGKCLRKFKASSIDRGYYQGKFHITVWWYDQNGELNDERIELNKSFWFEII